MLAAGVTPQQVLVGVIESGLEGQCAVGFIVDGLQAIAEELAQGRGDVVAGVVHADGVRLHDGRVGIHVNDEAWQAVAFAVDKSVGIVLRRMV